MTTIKRKSDFDLDSNGRCFFCLDQVIRQLNPSTLNPAVIECGSPTANSSLHSVHRLSKYLGIEMIKAFKDNVSSIPDHLLSRVRGSRLNVQLCSQCGSLNKEFSCLYRKLEKIQMEILSYVNHIKDKLIDIEEEVNFETKVREDLSGKLGIFKELRTEAKQKCSQKLATVQPQIKLKRTNMRNFRSSGGAAATTVEKCPDIDEEENHCTVLEPLKTEIKVEVSDINSFADYDNFTHEYFEDSIPPDSTLSYHQTANIPDVPSQPGTTYVHNEGLQKFHPNIVTKFEVEQSHESSGSGQEIRSVVETSDNRKAQCKLCGKTFSDQRSCQRHYQNVHQGIKFYCTICTKSFTQKHHLNAHIRVRHFGQVLHSCDRCGKVFTQKGDLGRHLKRCKFNSKVARS